VSVHHYITQFANWNYTTDPFSSLTSWVTLLEAPEFHVLRFRDRNNWRWSRTTATGRTSVAPVITVSRWRAATRRRRVQGTVGWATAVVSRVEQLERLGWIEAAPEDEADVVGGCRIGPLATEVGCAGGGLLADVVVIGSVSIGLHYLRPASVYSFLG